VKATIRLEYDPPQTARVIQVSSLFDIPAGEKLSHHLDADLPVEDKPWNVGLVVGPSGSGKSSLAKELWPGALLGEQKWSPDGALIDDFPSGMGIKEVIALLSAVGLSTIPSYLRPYRTLSTGEQFRASIARAMAENDGLVVVDEYSSVVDRQIARVASHALAKTVRRTARQLIAVSCHFDLTEWLQPDWTYDVATGEFTWRCLQPRPPIHVQIFPCDRSVWSAFSRFHFLSAELSASAKCFAATADGTLAGFIAYVHQPHAKTRNIKRITRTVVTPDFQGIGLGSVMSDWLGQSLYEQGFRLHSVTAHPVQQRIRARSPRWREVGSKPRLQVGPRSQMRAGQLDPRRLSTRCFEYQPPGRTSSRQPHAPRPGSGMPAASSQRRHLRTRSLPVPPARDSTHDRGDIFPSTAKDGGQAQDQRGYR
jgi:hypothetical protein